MTREDRRRLDDTLTREDLRRLNDALVRMEPIAYEFMGDGNEFPVTVAREVMILSQVDQGAFTGQALHHQAWDGTVVDRDRRTMILRSFNELRPGSVRRLCDIPVPECDDRPNVLLPEDFYVI